MKQCTLMIVGTDEGAIAAARAAFGRSSLGGEVRLAHSLEEALTQGSTQVPAILALVAPNEGEVARAAAVRDSLHLPAWAVVARGAPASTDQFEFVTPEHWTEYFLATVFRLGWSRLVLQRENAVFRGDLKSIGTRVVHDLRSPLGGILASTEALGEYLSASAPGEVARTQRILESEEDLLEIVKQLSQLANDFSVPLGLGRFNMGSAAGAALERLEGAIMAKHDTVVQPETWPEILGDKRKLERVWYILIENAIEHAGDGRRLELSWELSDRDYRFVLRDDGGGVPPDKIPLLFWPFHRLHDPGAARGLGLPIVERLIRLQGGRTGYEPGPAGGAGFYFTLPETP